MSSTLEIPIVGQSEAIAMPFTYEWPVRFGDVNRAGFVHHPTLFRAVHDAVGAMMESIGHPIYRIRPMEGIGMPIVHAEADYRAPIRHGDTVTFSLVPNLGRSSITCNSDGWIDDVMVCRTSVTHAVIDTKSFTSMPIPDRIREALARYAE